MKKDLPKWELQFKEKTIETDGHFGHNCEFEFRRAFKKLFKMNVNFSLNDYYSITIDLSETEPVRINEILLFVLTKLPGTSLCSYNKKKKFLYLEWHN